MSIFIANFAIVLNFKIPETKKECEIQIVLVTGLTWIILQRWLYKCVKRIDVISQRVYMYMGTSFSEQYFYSFVLYWCF